MRAVFWLVNKKKGWPTSLSTHGHFVIFFRFVSEKWHRVPGWHIMSTKDFPPIENPIIEKKHQSENCVHEMCLSRRPFILCPQRSDWSRKKFKDDLRHLPRPIRHLFIFFQKSVVTLPDDDTYIPRRPRIFHQNLCNTKLSNQKAADPKCVISTI